MLGLLRAFLRSYYKQSNCSLPRSQGCSEEKWTTWTCPQSKENHRLVCLGFILGKTYLFMQEVQLQNRSWFPTPGMKGVNAANFEVSSPNRSQIGYSYPVFQLLTPAQAMSPVRKTKSQGRMKWSFTIWLVTKAPKGVQVPMSPNTAILISSNSCTFRGGDLKYFTFEKTRVSASPTLQQYRFRGSRPVTTARYILPWKPRCPTSQVTHVPYAFPFNSPGSRPNSTIGLLYSSGVEAHITCISPSTLVNPIWICFGPLWLVTFTSETAMSSLRVTLRSRSASKNLKMGMMSSSVMPCSDSMSWKYLVNSSTVATPSLSASYVASQKCCKLLKETSAFATMSMSKSTVIVSFMTSIKFLSINKNVAKMGLANVHSNKQRRSNNIS